MEELNKMGRPKTGTKPIVNFRSNTSLSGKEVKTIIEEANTIFTELKILAIMVKNGSNQAQEQSKKLISLLNNNKKLFELLKKWEKDTK